MYTYTNKGLTVITNDYNKFMLNASEIEILKQIKK